MGARSTLGDKLVQIKMPICVTRKFKDRKKRQVKDEAAQGRWMLRTAFHSQLLAAHRDSEP